MVNAEHVVHCREQILSVHGALFRVSSIAIAGADDLSVLQSATGDEGAKHFGPVVAARFFVQGRVGRGIVMQFRSKSLDTCYSDVAWVNKKQTASTT